jgi:hypothetical protein
MCFSAEASLGTGGVLLVAGGCAGWRAVHMAPALLPIALYPVVFGVQQVVEGAIWIDLSSSGRHSGELALAFLFFSHLFWPVWAPFSIFWLRRGAAGGRLLLSLTGLGAVVGGLLFAPLLEAGSVPVDVVDGHISYATASVYEGSVAPLAVLIAYGAVVLLPFVLAGTPSIQAFGGLLLLSMLGAYAFYAATLISVWCFFAAIISAYVVLMVVHRTPPTGPRGWIPTRRH